MKTIIYIRPLSKREEKTNGYTVLEEEYYSDGTSATVHSFYEKKTL